MERTYPSKTFRSETGCGSLYLTIAYKPDGKFNFIKINAEKDCQCGNAWVDSMSDVITFAIRRASQEEIKPLLKQLTGHICNNKRPNKYHISSCPDALGKILQEELTDAIPK